MNIKIDISAPELAKAIFALAEALSNKPEIKVNSIPVSEPEEPTMSLVELRAKVTEAIKQGQITNADVRALLDKHGKQKLTDLDPNEYTAFVELLLPS